MAILDDLKTVMRISSTAFDTELNDLIAGAKSDLGLSGVISEKLADDADPIIRRAIFTYVKANFGWDNPDAERLQKSYDMLKTHLTLSQEYGAYTVTFMVTDGTNSLEDAKVTLGDEEKYTNALGEAVFTGIRAQQNLEYTVTLDDYQVVSGAVDVEGSTSVAVPMEAS